MNPLKSLKSAVAPMALGVTLVAAACGGSTTATSESSAPTTASDGASSNSASSNSASSNSASSNSAETTGNPLLTGSVGTVSGGQFDLGSLEGQDAVLWFWAPW